MFPYVRGRLHPVPVLLPTRLPSPYYPPPLQNGLLANGECSFRRFHGRSTWGNGLCAESLLWPFRGLVAAGGLRAAGSGAMGQGGQGVASWRATPAEEAQGNEPGKRARGDRSELATGESREGRERPQRRALCDRSKGAESRQRERTASGPQRRRSASGAVCPVAASLIASRAAIDLR